MSVFDNNNGQYPSLQQLVDAIASTLAMNLNEFCSDTKQVYLSRVVVKLDDGQTITSSKLLKTAESELVMIFYTTFEDVVDIYQEKLSRKPRLKELLETIKFPFNNQQSNHLSIEANYSLTDIEAELDREHRYAWVRFRNKGFISYEAICKMSEALDLAVATYSEQFGQMPTQQEILNALTYALQLNLSQICFDSNVIHVSRVIVMFEERQNLASGDSVQTASELLVIAFSNIFEVIVSIYNERWNRKPKLSEFLYIIQSELEATFCYSVLDADPENYIERLIIE